MIIKFIKYQVLVCIIFNFNTFGQNGVNSYTNISYDQKEIEDNRTLESQDSEKEVNGKENLKIHEDFEDISKNSKKSIPLWLVLPFLILLGMIASGPLFYPGFWHRYYSYIAVMLSIIIVSFYLFKFNDIHTPVSSAFEYLQFISLIGALYIASSGIYIKINTTSSPILNLIFLLLGSILSNFIGTTGASMLLIKPFIRLNKDKIKVFHIIFFIFMISNVGGALTPIGDPPLFLGFLKGIPFFWTLKNNFFPWLFTLILLGTSFFILDYKNNKLSKSVNSLNKISFYITGKKNFLWLLLIILCVFLDPNIYDWVPSFNFHGHKHSFLREFFLILIGIVAFKTANKTALKENEFSFEPLKEIVYIFIGIFGTMAPALELISTFAQSDYGKSLVNQNTLFWGAGGLSSFLDNAPTYLNFLAASISSQGGDISNISDVQTYAEGRIFLNSILYLKSISIASVFFGAMTYIGNGPNFMVKAIAEKMGIRMPSFFIYIFKYSLIFLLPILFLNWILFFK